VLTSFKEVEASLAAFNAQRARHAILADQAAAARSSAENQLRRLELGIGDYVAYLDALRQSLNVENTRVTAERDLAVARLNVHRALGGSWIELEEGS
jgi:outer membrane protein TolC